MRKLLAPFFVLVFLGGCATAPVDSPEKQIAAAKVTYAEIIGGITALHRNGDISDEVLVNKIEPARRAVRGALNEADTAIREKWSDAGDYLAAALRQVDNLQQLYEAYK